MAAERKFLAVVGAVLALILAFSPLMTKKASAAEYNIVLSDLDDCLTDEEEQAVLDKMSEVSQKVGINIGIVISADLTSKSNLILSSKKYLQEFSETNFGKDSDVVSLLLFNSHDLPQYYDDYDEIDTMGKGRKLYDNWVDDMFDSIYSRLDAYSPKSDLPSKPNVYKNYSSANYYLACLAFCSQAEQYGNPSMVFWYGLMEFIMTHGMAIMAGLIIAIIVVVIYSSSIKKRYSKKAPIGAVQYMDKKHTKVVRREDVFIREYTTSYRTSSSSGGGRSGGGGGGGGGSHGGGSGHHR